MGLRRQCTKPGSVKTALALLGGVKPIRSIEQAFEEQCGGRRSK